MIRDIDPLCRARLRLGAFHEPLLDIPGQAVKRLLHVDVTLGADFEEGDAEFVGELLPSLGGDGALLFPVTFVADEDFVDTLGGVLLDVGKPGPDVYLSKDS